MILRAHDVPQFLQVVQTGEVRIIPVASSHVLIDPMEIGRKDIDGFLGE